MRFSPITIFFAAAILGSAQDIDDNDVPQQCRAVCAPVLALTRDCDRRTDDDGPYIQCVCSAQNAASEVPLCEACVRQNDNDRDDNDVNDLVRSCSFQTTTFTGQASATGGSTPSGPGSNSASAAPSVSGASSVLTTPLVTTAPTTLATAAGTTGGPIQQSTNVAAVPFAPVAGGIVGALAAVVGAL